MKRETLLEKGYTEEQTTELLNLFHETNQQNQNLLNQLGNMKQYEAKYEEAQKKLDEIAKANMSEQERLETMLKNAQLKESEANKIYNKAKAKEILAGYNVDDKMYQLLVNEDEAQTIANAELYKQSLELQSELAIKKTKEDIASANIKPTPTNVDSEMPMTKERFATLSMVEQKKFKDANPDIYHSWY